MLSNPVDEKIYVNEAPQPLTEFQVRLFRFALEGGLVALVLGCGLGLRLFNLNRMSLWQDETLDLSIIRELNFFEVMTYSKANHIDPPAFYLLLDRWVAYFWESETSVRLLSITMAVLTMSWLYFVVRQWLGQRIALTSVFLLAISPLHLMWSQSSRLYTFFTLIVAVSMGLAYFASQKPRQNWRWIIYGLSLVVLIYTHYLSFHIIFAQALFFLIIFRKDWGVLVRAGITLALAGVSFLPWLPNFMEQAKAGPSTYLVNTGPGQLAEVLQILPNWYLYPGLLFLAGAISLPLYLLGLRWLWQNQPKLAIFLLLWSLLPPITSWTSSLWRPNFLGRYFIICVPAFLVVMAVGIWSLTSLRLGRVEKVESSNKPATSPLFSIIAIGLIIWLNISSIVNYEQNYQNQDWRGIVNYIVENRQPGDVIVSGNPYGYLTPAIEYYYVYTLGRPGNMEIHSFPVDYSIKSEAAPKKPVKEQVQELFAAHPRVWIIRKHDENGPWVYENVLKNIPSNFKAVFYKELQSEQGIIAFELHVKQ